MENIYEYDEKLSVMENIKRKIILKLYGDNLVKNSKFREAIVYYKNLMNNSYFINDWYPYRQICIINHKKLYEYEDNFEIIKKFFDSGIYCNYYQYYWFIHKLCLAKNFVDVDENEIKKIFSNYNSKGLKNKDKLNIPSLLADRFTKRKDKILVMSERRFNSFQLLYGLEERISMFSEEENYEAIVNIINLYFNYFYNFTPNFKDQFFKKKLNEAKSILNLNNISNQKKHVSKNKTKSYAKRKKSREKLIKNNNQIFDNLITISSKNFSTLLKSDVGDIVSLNYYKNFVKFEIVDIDYLDEPYRIENLNIDYIFKKYSGYVVKFFKGKKIHIYGYYDNIKHAYFVRDFLIENNWDMNKFKCIEFDEKNFLYYIVKIVKDRVYIIDEFHTYNGAYLNYINSLKEFVIKIYWHKYGIKQNYYVNYLMDVAEELFLEVDGKTNDDSWLIDKLPIEEVEDEKYFNNMEENEFSLIDYEMINLLSSWQYLIYSEVNKFDDEIFSFNKLVDSVSRYKTKNFENKVRKYLNELINLKLIINLGDDNYQKNW